MSDPKITELTAEIVANYVGANTIPPEAVSDLIKSVYGTLSEVATGTAPVSADPVKLVPAVPIKKSVTPEFLISLEDGRKYKSLKRHLRTAYDLSPEDYRAKWGLPKDYPMVAPAYSASRSALAKSMGLGRAQAAEAAKPKAARKARAPKVSAE